MCASAHMDAHGELIKQAEARMAPMRAEVARWQAASSVTLERVIADAQRAIDLARSPLPNPNLAASRTARGPLRRTLEV